MILQLLFLFFSMIMTIQNYSASTIATTTPSEKMRNIIEILAIYDENNVPEAQKKLYTIKNLLNSLNKKQEAVFLSFLVYRHQCQNDCRHLSTATCEDILFKDLNNFKRYTWKMKFWDNKEMEYVRSHNLVDSTLSKRYFLLAKLFIEKGFGYVTTRQIQNLLYHQWSYSIEQRKHTQSILRVFNAINYEKKKVNKNLFVTYLKMCEGNYQSMREMLLLEPLAIQSATGENFAIQEMANAMEHVFKPDSIKPILQFLVHTAPEKDKLLLQKVQIEYERYLNLDAPPLWKSRMHEIDGFIRPGFKESSCIKVDLQYTYQDTMPEDSMLETFEKDQTILQSKSKSSFVQKMRSLTTQDEQMINQPKAKDSFTQKIRSISGQSEKTQ